MKVDIILKELQNNKVVNRSRLNDLCEWGRNVTSLIQVLQRKWYNIETIYNESQMPLAYTLIEYVQPFYIISRNIERNYPEFAKEIRDKYNKLISK